MGVPTQQPGLSGTKAVYPVDGQDDQKSLESMLNAGVRVFSLDFEPGNSKELAEDFKLLMAAKKETGSTTLATVLNIGEDFADEAQTFAFSHGVGYIAVPVSSEDDLMKVKGCNPRLRNARFLAKLPDGLPDDVALKIVAVADGLFFDSALDVSRDVTSACVNAGKPCVCTGTEGIIASEGRALLLEKKDNIEMTMASATQAINNLRQLSQKNVGPASSNNEKSAQIAEALNLAESSKLIVVLTETGDAVRKLAQFHPKTTIVAVSASTAVCGHLQLVRGVIPLQTGSMQSPQIAMETACKNAVDMGLGAVGDPVVAIIVLKEGIAGQAQMTVEKKQL